MKQVGLSANRLTEGAGNPREVIFAKAWDEICEASGTVYWLLAPSRDESYLVSDRDRQVAATIIQWLGSPVGFGFLEDCLTKIKYKLEGGEEQRRRDQETIAFLRNELIACGRIAGALVDDQTASEHLCLIRAQVEGRLKYLQGQIEQVQQGR